MAVHCIAIISTNEIVTGLTNGTLNLWNLTTKQYTKFDGLHEAPVTSIVVVSKWEIVSVAGHGHGGNSIKIWNLQTFKCINTIKRNFITILPNKLLVSISDTSNELEIYK